MGHLPSLPGTEWGSRASGASPRLLWRLVPASCHVRDESGVCYPPGLSWEGRRMSFHVGPRAPGRPSPSAPKCNPGRPGAGCLQLRACIPSGPSPTPEGFPSWFCRWETLAWSHWSHCAFLGIFCPEPFLVPAVDSAFKTKRLLSLTPCPLYPEAKCTQPGSWRGRKSHRKLLGPGQGQG